MPLPAGGPDRWPPPDFRRPLDDARAWAAWWSGDLMELIATAATDVDPMVQQNQPNEKRFNLNQLIRRRFWQRRGDQRDPTVATRPVHAPLAADIAVTSADLLFGELPDLTIPMSTTKAGAVKADRTRDAVQARLEELIEALDLWARFLEGAEACSATGGVYLRAVWDPTLADHPLTTILDQRQALPEFSFGQLRAVTFWEVVRKEGSAYWRHLERHEPGLILHGLYEGTADTLGTARDLTMMPATAAFEPVMALPAGLPYPLVVEYVPNVLPNRRHRLPVGRSDFASSEGFLDGLDEVWTSLFRDFRLGQARIVTPLEFLTAAGTGPSDGRKLDVDQELFTGLNIDEFERLSEPMKLIQPELRLADHSGAVTDLVRTIVSAAGYSPQTFGLDIVGAAESGTALRVREKKTIHTTNRKRGYWQAGVQRHSHTLLALDAVLFGGPGAMLPHLEWPELDDDPIDRAQTAGLWRSAQAMSIKEAVRYRNPQWSEDQVDEEVELIESETAAKNPMALDQADDEANPPGQPKSGEPQPTPDGGTEPSTTKPSGS